jgi:hypothetical protein
MIYNSQMNFLIRPFQVQNLKLQTLKDFAES